MTSCPRLDAHLLHKADPYSLLDRLQTSTRYSDFCPLLKIQMACFIESCDAFLSWYSDFRAPTAVQIHVLHFFSNSCPSRDIQNPVLHGIFRILSFTVYSESCPLPDIQIPVLQWIPRFLFFSVRYVQYVEFVPTWDIKGTVARDFGQLVSCSGALKYSQFDFAEFFTNHIVFTRHEIPWILSQRKIS